MNADKKLARTKNKVNIAEIKSAKTRAIKYLKEFWEEYVKTDSFKNNYLAPYKRAAALFYLRKKK